VSFLYNVTCWPQCPLCTEVKSQVLVPTTFPFPTELQDWCLYASEFSTDIRSQLKKSHYTRKPALTSRKYSCDSSRLSRGSSRKAYAAVEPFWLPKMWHTGRALFEVGVHCTVHYLRLSEILWKRIVCSSSWGPACPDFTTASICDVLRQ